MKIIAEVEGQPGLGFQIQLAKKRNGAEPDIVLEPYPTILITDTPDPIRLVTLLPLHPDQRERALREIRFDMKFHWNCDFTVEKQ